MEQSFLLTVRFPWIEQVHINRVGGAYQYSPSLNLWYRLPFSTGKWYMELARLVVSLCLNDVLVII
jgi:hypothetical protein